MGHDTLCFAVDRRISPFCRNSCVRLWVFAVVIVLAGSCSKKEVFEISLRNYPADGRSGGTLIFHSNDKNRQLVGPTGNTGSIHIIRRESTTEGERVYFRSTTKPGTVSFQSEGQSLTLQFLSTAGDADEDGFPDLAELVSEQDRLSFRAWFIRISESQLLKTSLAWHGQERDCSGLIRFAYREALKVHDNAWQRRTGIVLDKNLPDVSRFSYPAIPVIGKRLFRVMPGSAGTPTIQREFAAFASAEYLMKYNTRQISRDVMDALPGDLLFFHDENQPEGDGDYHSMIITQPRSNEDTILIYHTGGAAGLKRVPTSYLLNLNDRRFQPIAENPHFLGVFRFLILD